MKKYLWLIAFPKPLSKLRLRQSVETVTPKKGHTPVLIIAVERADISAVNIVISDSERLSYSFFVVPTEFRL